MSDETIASRECPACEVCGTKGIVLYSNLEDVLYGAPGKWTLKQCTNDQCGMLWLDPMPMTEELYKAYRTYSTHQDSTKKEGLLRRLAKRAYAGYRANHFHFNSAHVTASDKMLGMAAALFSPVRQQMGFPFAYFDDLAKTRMLDIGCGAGDTLKLFAEWGWDAEGLDFDQAAVENARAKGLKVHQGDVFACNYQANSFNAIYSHHVLEHVPDTRKLLEECLRILKPGGRCVMVTPNASSIGHQRFKSAWRGLEPPRHLHLYTPAALANLARSAGFTDFRIETKSSSIALRFMYIESMKIRKNNGIGKETPLNLKVRAMIFYLAAYFYYMLKQQSGEELILVGNKQK